MRSPRSAARGSGRPIGGRPTRSVRGALASPVRDRGRYIDDRRNDIIEYREDRLDDYYNYRGGRYRYASGVRFGRIPSSYSMAYVSGRQYYYDDGYFYRSGYWNGEMSYTVVDAPMGIVVYELPDWFTAVIIAGVTYYTDGVVYYQRRYSGGRIAFKRVADPTY